MNCGQLFKVCIPCDNYIAAIPCMRPYREIGGALQTRQSYLGSFGEFRLQERNESTRKVLIEQQFHHASTWRTECSRVAA